MKNILFVLFAVAAMVISACSQAVDTVPAASVPESDEGKTLGDLPSPPPAPGTESGDLSGQAVEFSTDPDPTKNDCLKFKNPLNVQQAAGGPTPVAPNVVTTLAPKTTTNTDMTVVSPSDAARGLVKADGTPLVATLPDITIFPKPCTVADGSDADTNPDPNPALVAGEKCYTRDATTEGRDVVDFGVNKPTPASATEHYFLYRKGYVFNWKNLVWEQFQFQWNGPATTVFDDPASNAEWLSLDKSTDAVVRTQAADALKFTRVPGVNVGFSYINTNNVIERNPGLIVTWVCSCDDAVPTKVCEDQATWECNSITGTSRGLGAGKYALTFYGEREAAVGAVPPPPGN